MTSYSQRMSNPLDDIKHLKDILNGDPSLEMLKQVQVANFRTITDRYSV